MDSEQELTKKTLDLLRSYTSIMWDFDGVIKDSVDIKTKAYESLFMPYGANVAKFVKEHHEANGGMSRFDKIPTYLKFAGLSSSDPVISDFCARFSKSVMEGVIDSPWVPGVKEYLVDSNTQQLFVLVTATPQAEIEIILDRLGISSCFKKVFGAPIRKEIAVSNAMEIYGLSPNEVLMIGDSSSDLQAAKRNSIPFLLRKTLINNDLVNSYDGPQFEDLLQ
jgi:phosphoglycolate phosphatase-like HAD superfamily hydrolase